MSQVRVSEKKRGRGLWAALGFVLIAACAAISWAITPSVVDFLDAQVRSLRIRGTLEDQAELIVGIIVFLILTSIAALLVSVFAPKRSINVKESDLIKERELAMQARKADKIRQRQINREFREQREAKTGGGTKKR
jgi:hypothetical protein